MARTQYTLEPVGQIETDGAMARIRIDEVFRPALIELDGFSHIQVLWWGHLLDTPEYRSLTVAERPYRNAPDQIGIVATRSPARPNPVGLTAVPILSIDHEAGVIEVPFIDAENGTPVLDVKPYHPSVDRVRSVAVPEWCRSWPEWYEDSATFDWGSVFAFSG